VSRYYSSEYNTICLLLLFIGMQIFSLPEPKSQVSYCHRNLSGVRLSIC